MKAIASRPPNLKSLVAGLFLILSAQSCYAPPPWIVAGTFTEPPDHLVTITSERGIVVWDTQQRPLRVATWEEAKVRDIVSVPGGGGVLAATDEGMFLLGKEGWEGAWQLSSPAYPLTTVAWVPGSQMFVAGGEGGHVTSWEMTELGNIPRLLWTHEGPVTSLAVSADGTTVASGDEDGVVKVGPLPVYPQREGEISGVAVEGGNDPKPRASTGAPLAFSFPGDIRDLALNPSGTAMVAVFFAGSFLERWLVRLTPPLDKYQMGELASEGSEFVDDYAIVAGLGSTHIYRLNNEFLFEIEGYIGLSPCDASQSMTVIAAKALVATSSASSETCLVDLNATPDNPGRTTRLQAPSRFVVASANGELIAAINGRQITVVEVEEVLAGSGQ